MRQLLIIGLGSFIGGILRYLASSSIQTNVFSSFPYGTFFVNVTGCFFIGLVFGWSERVNLAPEWRLFLATGLLGGFTTFSTFSNETFGLLRDGQFGYASLYIFGSIGLGLVATLVGYSALKII